MGEFFADFIYQKLNINKDKEISMSKLKDMLQEGGEEAELLEYICGFPDLNITKQ